jgi:hypothetical protein
MKHMAEILIKKDPAKTGTKKGAKDNGAISHILL